MKYSWDDRRYWWSWIKSDTAKIYYKYIHGFDMSFNGTMVPKTGKGQFVSVYQKGKIIQIIDEEGRYDEIRIIPYKENHGVMVETWRNGKMRGRSLLDIIQLNKGIIYASNVEDLTGKYGDEKL